MPILVQDTARPTLDLIGPSYTLDNNYYFSDWNPAFDTLVAKPLGLARADHCMDFIKRLENCDEVVERSKNVFAPGKDPLVDTEELRFQSPAYGLIKFRKIAALINDQKGNPLNWTVNLNIASAEKEAELWRDLEQKLREVVNWSRYAVSYDKLLYPIYGLQRVGGPGRQPGRRCSALRRPWGRDRQWYAEAVANDFPRDRFGP